MEAYGTRAATHGRLDVCIKFAKYCFEQPGNYSILKNKISYTQNIPFTYRISVEYIHNDLLMVNNINLDNGLAQNGQAFMVLSSAWWHFGQ